MTALRGRSLSALACVHGIMRAIRREMNLSLSKQVVVVASTLAVISTLIIGCGSSTNGTSDAGVDGTGAPTCETKAAVELGIGTVLDAVIVNGVPTALVNTGSELRVVTATSSATIATVAATADGAIAVDPTGRVCVAYRLMRNDEQSTFQFACAPNWRAIDTLQKGDSAAPKLSYSSKICATAANGCVPSNNWILYYQGRFASVEVATAPADGSLWSDENMSISSVTAPYGVADLDGQSAACFAGNGAVTLLTNHPYRGEIDDVVAWASRRGSVCKIAASGRDIAVLFDGEPGYMLAQWTVPLLPTQMWPVPPAAVATPLVVGSVGTNFALSQWGATLAVAFQGADATLQFATYKDGAWNQGPLGPVINGPLMLVSDAATLGVFATVQGKTTLWQKCQ